MHTAIAKLQGATRRLYNPAGLEHLEYSRIAVQVRDVADDVSRFERRAKPDKINRINFTEILRSAEASAPAATHEPQSGVIVQAPLDVMIDGPADDLRDLVCSLTEYALTVARNPVVLRAEVRYVGAQARAVCATELVIQSPEVPGLLRRKLRDVVRVRHGEVSVASNSEHCHVEFILPIERRLGTILG
jgi:hypothetical protein